jgi:PEGA domain
METIAMRRLLSLGHYVVLMVLMCAAVLPLPAQQNANPGRAGVFIDGKYAGPAKSFGRARKYAVAPGHHEIKLLDPRYEDFTTAVDIEAGKTATISQDLKARELIKPPYGTLRIKGFDKFASVYVNDRFVGHADEFNNFAQGLLLNPGQYDVRVEPLAGGSPVSEHVTIEANKDTFVRKP